MYQALTDQTLQEKCQTLAPAVAQKYSACTMVKHTIEAYEQAAVLQMARGHLNHRVLSNEQ